MNGYSRSLANYIAFNGIFGAGVASLAGSLGIRQDLFRDPEEPIASLADRSMDVAADILYACIDEFDDSSTPTRIRTARSPVPPSNRPQSSLGLSDEKLNALAQPRPETLAFVPRVTKGYGVNRVLADEDLFRAMGFHMGSEILADGEFGMIDGYLRTSQPELVAFLQGDAVVMNGETHGAYWWIKVHTTVEEDHFRYAERGMGSAIRYYSGQLPVSTLTGLVAEGFEEFSSLQTEFMRTLASI